MNLSWLSPWHMKNLRRYAAFGALGTSALSLWTWAAGVGDLFTFGAHPPVAPSTGILFLILSLAFLSLRRRSSQRPGVRVPRFAASAVCVVGLYVIANWAVGHNSPAEEWLGKVFGQSVTARPQFMLPWTGACFVLLGASLVLQLRPGPPTPPRARLPAGLALAALAISAFFLLAFAADGIGIRVPRLQSGMAVLTALGMLFLSAAFAGGIDAPAPSMDGLQQAKGSLVWLPYDVALVVALICGGLTAGYLRHEQTQDRTEARESLEAIGQLKQAQLLTWRRERMRDVRFFVEENPAAREVNSFLGGNPTERTRERLVRWLDLLQSSEDHAAAALYDKSGRLRLAAGATNTLPAQLGESLVARATAAEDVVLVELEPVASTTNLFLGLVAPLRRGEETNAVAGQPATELQGFVVVRLEPRAILFSLLQSWPTPNHSAEVGLFRREQDELVVLNTPPPGVRNALTRTRFPLKANSAMPAVQALGGQSGIVEGIDYRGTPVLAYVRPVPGTSWYLGTKIDRSEIYAHLQENAVLTLSLTALLVLATGLLAGLHSKREEAARAQADLAAEFTRRELSERIEHLMDGAYDPIIVSDEQNRITDANQRALQTYGYTPEELREMSAPQLRVPQARPLFAEDTGRAIANGKAIFETVHQRKDGSTFPAEVSVSLIELGGRVHKLGIVRDITERKAHEREIERLNRLYATLSDINQTIVRSVTRRELLEKVCSILTGSGSFKCVSVSWFEATTSKLEPLASAGESLAYFQEAARLADGNAPTDRPAARCLQTGKSWILNDIQTEASDATWKAAAETFRLRAMAAIPFRMGGKVCGAFEVYAAEPGVFREKEVALLEETAVDISFALENLEHENKRREAEEALKEAQERLQLALAAAQMGVWEYELSSQAVVASPLCFEILGLTATGGSLTAAELLAPIHPEDREQLRTDARHSIAKSARLNIEFRLVRPDGSFRFAAAQAKAIYDAQGQPLRLVGTIQDITPRRRAESEVRKLSRALEQSSASVIITDLEGRIEYVNSRFCTVTGYTLGEVIGKNPRVLKGGSTPQEAYRDLWRTVTSGNEWHGELQNKKKNGELFWETVSISPILDENGRASHYMAVKEDITERKRLESDLLQAQKMEAVGQLAGGVAHDFNNILAAMMLHLGLLDSRDDLPVEVKTALTELANHTERAAALTRQLLLFSRRSVMRVRTLDINIVVEHLLNMLRRIIGEQNQLSWRAKSHLPNIRGDAGMLEQVIMNLVVNARDAMPNGGQITIATDLVHISEEQARHNPQARAGSFVCVAVSDNGCGIKENNLRHIFEPFFTTKEAGKGTGLGLATVHGIASQHQGWVEVESKVGAGSTFRVLLPAVETPAQSNATPQVTKRLPTGQETILLVEDDAAVRLTVAIFLKRLGYRILEASHATEAIAVWNKNEKEISLLLSDMVMPNGMTGFQLAQHLRTLRPALKVIITSGYSADLIDKNDLAAAGIVFLAKPCEPARLASSVRQVLDGVTPDWQPSLS